MADHGAELHHAAPRCLLRLHRTVNGHAEQGDRAEALLEFERWGRIIAEDLDAMRVVR